MMGTFTITLLNWRTVSAASFTIARHLFALYHNYICSVHTWAAVVAGGGGVGVLVYITLSSYCIIIQQGDQWSSSYIRVRICMDIPPGFPTVFSEQNND